MSALPPRLDQWSAEMSEACHAHGVDVPLGFAILERESRGGTALRPAGPAGTGDHAPRRYAMYEKRGTPHRFKIWKASADEWLKWFPKRKDAPALICLPADGLGWGRGLMQPDWASKNLVEVLGRDFLAETEPDGTPSWKVGARNINAGIEYLSKLIHMFDGHEDFAAAAYNAGPDNVREALGGVTRPATDYSRTRAVDQVTTGKNYASDVMSMRDRYRRALASVRTAQPD